MESEYDKKDSDLDYSKREVDQYFKEINVKLDHIKDDFGGSLGEIKVQTKETNGRVKALEFWKQFVIGGMAVGTFLVIPLLGFIFNSIYGKIGEIENQVDKITNILSGYNIVIE